MNSKSAFREYASLAKSRLLREGYFPSLVGKVPYKKYETLIKMAGSDNLLCKICNQIENGNDMNPLTYIIDREMFNNLSPSEQQRYVFRLCEVYKRVKLLYAEMEQNNK